MSNLDLTPFGFTPTENAVYQALVERGPSGGYSLSNALGIARANTYQALRALVTKHAAVLVTEKPAEYRAVRPEALYARIVDHQSTLLERLETQISGRVSAGSSSIVPVESRRSFTQIVMKEAARAPADIRFVGPPAFIRELAPAWRKRENDGLGSEIWSVGEIADPPIAIAGVVGPSLDRPDFEFAASLYLADTVAVVFGPGDPDRGFWTDQPLLLSMFDFAFKYIVSP